MKFLVLALTLLSLQAHAEKIQDFIEVHSAPLVDPGMMQIQTLATDLINTHHLSSHPNSCGEVITFRGPTEGISARNLRTWIRGIEVELGALNQDEDVKLNPVKLNYPTISQSVTLLADRNKQLYDVAGVNEMSTAIFNETQKNPKNYYVLFGDYLDGKTGWMTAVVLVRMSSGEAVMLANSNDCF